MAPLTRAQNNEPAEVEKDLLRSELDKVVQFVNITETKSIEDEKESVPPVKEHKPYIVEATPKDVVQPVVEIVNNTFEDIKEVKEEVEEVPKEETIAEKYPPRESSVEEEQIDQPAGNKDIIAPGGGRGEGIAGLRMRIGKILVESDVGGGNQEFYGIILLFNSIHLFCFEHLIQLSRTICLLNFQMA